MRRERKLIHLKLEKEFRFEVVQIPEVDVVRNLFESVHAETTFFVDYCDINLSFNRFRKIMP